MDKSCVRKPYTPNYNTRSHYQQQPVHLHRAMHGCRILSSIFWRSSLSTGCIL
jgi:hypothetical protein